MKKLKHKGSCKTAHPDQSHAKWEEIQGNKEEGELDELADFDGSLLSSKIPLGINKTNKISKSTTDDVIKTGSQKGGAGSADDSDIDTTDFEAVLETRGYFGLE